MQVLLFFALMLSAAGCEKQPGTAAGVAQPSPAQATAAATLERFECNRCHAIAGIAPTTVNMDCRECHRQIILGTYPEPQQYLEMWDKGLENMRDVPSLVGVEKRLTREWFVRFVQRPEDLRPRLGATMPRMAITPTDAESLADALRLVPARDDATLTGDPERGRAVLDARGCGSCHTMSGLDTPIVPSPIGVEMDPDLLARATLLAPDLRHARDRFRREQLVAWLMNPSAMKPDALMPRVGLTEAEARDAAAFIVSTPLTASAATATPDRLPVLERTVGWKEVQTKLFDEICLHCHSDPKYNEGDGGPGNTGGFGYAGKKLDVSSYERAVRDRSFYAAGADGTPKMVAHLMARHDEVASRPGARLGMPLGFPPIDLVRIQLLESWIAQGLPE